MHIKIRTKLEDLNGIKEDWHRLFDEGSRYSVFDHFDWIYQAYNKLHNDNILLMLIYNDENELTGIFPFTVYTLKIKKLSFRALTHASSDFSDYSSFIVSKNINKKVAISRIIDKLVELQPGSWDFYNIGGLNDADDTARLFRLLLQRFIYGTDYSEATILRINFTLPFGEAKKRSNIKRRFNKLFNVSSNVSLHIEQTINYDTIDNFRTLHNDQFQGMGFSSQSSNMFFDNLLRNAWINNHLDISYITVDGKIIAGHFGFKDGVKLYYYIPVYNQEYKKYGPGQYLLMAMIDHYHNRGYKEFDFLRGGDYYKYHWANTSCSNYRIFGCPSNAGFIMKTIVNLWVLTKTLPAFIAGNKN